MVPILTEPVSLETAGEERLIASVRPDVPVDALGTTTGGGFALDHRLRTSLDLKAKGWKIGTEWDLFSGQIGGATWDLEGTLDERHREQRTVLSADAFVPRRANLEGKLGPVQLNVGLQTSHWGLGMVANDGAHDPTFGRSDFGDRVIRARVATRPLGPDVAWTVALAGDRVLADDTARLVWGQDAWQGVFATVLGDAKGRTGLYAVYRHQTEESGEVTTAQVIDVYAEGSRPAGSWTLSAGFEGAGITGFTERSRSVTSVEGLNLKSAGLTGYLAARGLDDRLEIKARAGWASGDADPDDDTSRDFSFDRDYDAGMVLFDEVQAAINAQSYNLLSDLEHTGHVADGADGLVDEGALKRASFVQPVLDLSIQPWLGLRAGATLAWSTAPVAHPYYTFRAGGTPSNQLNEPTDGYKLGTELDWALRVSAPGDAITRPDLLVQGGHLLPSANLGLDGVAHLIMVQGRVRW